MEIILWRLSILHDTSYGCFRICRKVSVPQASKWLWRKYVNSITIVWFLLLQQILSGRRCVIHSSLFDFKKPFFCFQKIRFETSSVIDRKSFLRDFNLNERILTANHFVKTLIIWKIFTTWENNPKMTRMQTPIIFK